MYRDPGIAPAAHPGRIPEDMIDRVDAILSRVRWRRAEVARFVGAWMSEPKPHVLFAAPPRPLAAAAFARRVARDGLRLAGATILLIRGRYAYANGDEVLLRPDMRALLARLADRRTLPGGTKITESAAALLYSWYRSGYLVPGAMHE
jgi:50S ribosomal protein L16 3-hydroxylase